jgi:uncharacterized membrane protein
MQMSKLNLKLFFALLIIDLTWIMMLFKNPFGEMINKVQGSPMKVNSSYALVAYMLLYLMAVTFLPRLTYKEAFLLGFLTYGIYDFTNLATLKNWRLEIALIDTIWGGLLFLLLKHLAF